MPDAPRSSLFDLYEYKDSEGNFDYERYRAVQAEGNRRKLHRVWVEEDNIAFLSRYIARIVKQPRFGLCHGTRRGNEQAWFKKYLGCDMLGTEISDTASQFPDTIEWDFHEVKPEWRGNVDFIYSNSFDHSHDPKHCLDQWMSCIRPGGVCIIEHSDRHGRDYVTELDPFGADLPEFVYLALRWGAGRYCVREILDAPHVEESLKSLAFVVLQNV